jgi:hypothetical protein
MTQPNSKLERLLSQRAHTALWRPRLLHHLVSSGNIHRNAGGGRRPSVGDRGQQILAWVASPRFPGDARLRDDGGDPLSRQSATAKKKERRTTAKKSSAMPSLIRWSIQEIRRVAIRLARKRTNPHTSSHGHSGVGLTKRSLSEPTSKQKGNCNVSPGPHGFRP